MLVQVIALDIVNHLNPDTQDSIGNLNKHGPFLYLIC